MRIQSRAGDAARYRRWGLVIVILALTGWLVSLMLVPPQTCEPGVGLAGCEFSWGGAVLRLLWLTFVGSISALLLFAIATVRDAQTDMSMALLELSDQVAELSGVVIDDTPVPTSSTSPPPQTDIGPLTVEQRAQMRAELLDQRDAESAVTQRRSAATEAAARLRSQRKR